MTKKQSMGHNPLAYSLKSHASFDFIRDIQEEDGSDSEEAKPVEKKVASYYLEKPIVDEIREIAETEDRSFSSVANEFLKSALKSKDEIE
ncbi:MAG: hypothetical protein ABJH08_01480 [Balneola sp.]